MANELKITIDDNKVLHIDFADAVVVEKQSGWQRVKDLNNSGRKAAQFLNRFFPEPKNLAADPLFYIAQHSSTDLYRINGTANLRSYTIGLYSNAAVELALNIINKAEAENHIDAENYALLKQALSNRPKEIVAEIKLEAETKAVPAGCRLEIITHDLDDDIKKLTALNNNEELAGMQVNKETHTISVLLLRANFKALAQFISGERTQSRQDYSLFFKVTSQDKNYDFAFMQTMLKKFNDDKIPADITINSGVLKGPLTLNTIDALLYLISAAAKNDLTPACSLTVSNNAVTLTINDTEDKIEHFRWLDDMIKEANQNVMPPNVKVKPYSRTVPLTKENAEPLFRYIKEICESMSIVELAVCLKVIKPLLSTEQAATFTLDDFPALELATESASSNNNNNASALFNDDKSNKLVL